MKLRIHYLNGRHLFPLFLLRLYNSKQRIVTPQYRMKLLQRKWMINLPGSSRARNIHRFVTNKINNCRHVRCRFQLFNTAYVCISVRLLNTQMSHNTYADCRPTSFVNPLLSTLPLKALFMSGNYHGISTEKLSRYESYTNLHPLMTNFLRRRSRRKLFQTRIRARKEQFC